MGLFDDAAEEAAQANSNRRRNIREQYRSLYDRADLEGLTSIEAPNIARDYQGLRTRTNQGLVDSGLWGTTVRPTMDASITRQESEAQQQANQRLRREKLGWDTNLTWKYLDWVDRQQNVAAPSPFGGLLGGLGSLLGGGGLGGLGGLLGIGNGLGTGTGLLGSVVGGIGGLFD